MHHESLEPRRLLSATGTSTALSSAAALAAPTVQLPGYISTADLGAGSTFKAGNNSLSGGSFAGWSTVGSVANYAVTSNGGTFVDTLRYAANSSGDQVQAQVDGQNVGSPVNLPSTGGWYAWRSVHLPTISLSSGVHTVSIVVTGGSPSANIQRWNFSQQVTPVPPTPTPPPTVPPPTVPPPPVPPPPAVGSVTGFELFDGATQKDLGPITEGETITETSGQTFAIRASTSGSIGSVQFNLDNGTRTSTDNSAPYDVFGTAADGSSTPGTLNAGSHTISATPYASANDQGSSGTVYHVDFSVVQQTPTPTPPPPVVPPPPPPPPPTVPPPPPPSGSAPIPGNWTQAFDTNFGQMNNLGPWTPNNFWGVSGIAAAGQEIDVPGNVVLANGVLNLYARKQSDGSWTGGEATTGGLEGSSSLPVFNFTYGYAQATIKSPAGVGAWPAFWMLPYSSHGEIDVNETLDEQPTAYYTTVHLSGQTGHTVNTGVDMTAGFHTYGVDWEPTGLTFYFDGKAVWTETSMIPTEAENLLLDLGISDGSWGQAPNSSTPSVMDMQVSDVQVWQHSVAGAVVTKTNSPAINAGSSLAPTTANSTTPSTSIMSGTSSNSTPAFDALSSGSSSSQQNKVL